MRIEEALIKKTRPKFNSKRYWLLQNAAGFPVCTQCEICGKMLLNPQSIIIHQGGFCQSRIYKTKK